MALPGIMPVGEPGMDWAYLSITAGLSYYAQKGFPSKRALAFNGLYELPVPYSLFTT